MSSFGIYKRREGGRVKETPNWHAFYTVTVTEYKNYPTTKFKELIVYLAIQKLKYFKNWLK